MGQRGKRGVNGEEDRRTGKGEEDRWQGTERKGEKLEVKGDKGSVVREEEGEGGTGSGQGEVGKGGKVTLKKGSRDRMSKPYPPPSRK